MIGIGQDMASDKVKLSLLRNMMGTDSARVLLTFPLNEEDAKTYCKVIEAIQKYVNPRVNEVFERYKFNERKQKAGENFENFFTDCKSLIQKCNYKSKLETIEDQLLRDKIVHGISDKSVQESLLRIENLTLQKAANFVRTSEQSKIQVKEMNPEMEVDRVARRDTKRYGYNVKNFNKRSNGNDQFLCRRCKEVHGARQCKAYGEKCKRCGLLNHFAIACRVRNNRIQNVEVEEKQVLNQEISNDSDSSDSILYCGRVKNVSKADWTEEIFIEGKKIQCRLDTGADVSVMSLRNFESLKTKLTLREVSLELESFQGDKTKPLGMVNLNCKFGDNECYENFMIIENDCMLLGLPGCLKLNLVRRVHKVSGNGVNDDQKQKFVSENADIFKGHDSTYSPEQKGTQHQGPWRRELIVALSSEDGSATCNKDTRGRKSPCNQQRCTKMQERLTRHVDTHHRNKPNSSQRSASGSIIAHSAQTDLNSINNSRLDSKNTIRTKAYKEQNRKVIPLRKTETQKLLAPKRKFYKQHLQDVVLKWFLKIPVFPTMNNKIKLKRLKVINELVDNIADLSSDIGNVNYNKKLKHDIQVCLDVLPMWYPGSKIDKYLFRNNLCQILLKKIESLNEKWLFIENDEKGVVTTYDVLTFPFDDGDDAEMLKYEIANWVDANLKKYNNNIDSQLIADIFFKRLVPMLNSNSNEKDILRAEVTNILDDLSKTLKFPKSSTMYFNKLAIDLIDRVLGLNYKNQNSKIYIDEMDLNKVVIIKYTDDGQQISLQSDMDSEEIANIHTLSEDSEEETFKEVTDIVYDSIDSAMIRCNGGNCLNNVQDICEALEDCGEFTEDVASNLASTLEDMINYNDDIHLNMGNQRLSGTLVVLTSEHDFSGPYDKALPLTSTPLLPELKKIPGKLNCEEKAYMKKIVDLVREWLNTTDIKFDTIDDKNLKETIANDLAIDVKDLAKLFQIQENMMMSYFESVLTFIIMRAILKYGLLNITPKADTPQVVDLKERIKGVGIPDMMMPRNDNRQDIASIKLRCDNPRCSTDLKPDDSNILEDNMAVWLNEQPSDIYKDNNRERRNVLLHEVAKKVQEKMKNNMSEDTIKADLREWLRQILNPNMNKDIDGIAEDLKNKIMKLPQNETIYDAAQKRYLASEETDFKPKQQSVNIDTDEQLKDFIEKFIEQNYNVSDPLARGAFANILLQELVKLSPALTNATYDSESQEVFNPDKFRLELEYIKEVSDWLKNIPFYPMLTSGSDRVEFVNGLAKNIADIEEERIKHPGNMNYESMLHGHIFEYMKRLPFPQQYIPNLVTCVNQLRERIARHRPDTSPSPINCQPIAQSNQNKQDFANFIEEFLVMHSKEIGDDQVKLEAYLARLLKEIKRFVLEKASTDTLTDSQVHNKLANVPMPGKESIQRFSTEMKYAHEIAEWLHNFPLIPLRSREDIECRMRMISELAEKMVDTDLETVENSYSNAHEELEKYIADWITKLQLYPDKEIVVPILISQLKNRMEIVKKEPERQQLHETVVGDTEERSIKRSSSKLRVKSATKDCPCCESTKVPKEPKYENPGDLIVKAIESWCNGLPIHEKDDDSTKVVKEKVATIFFQKVGLLNVDPRVVNDDHMYEDMLADKIETELQNLSKYIEICNKKDNLKSALLDKVMDAKKVIKEMSAGENYKQALENTIDASLPNPVHISNKAEPGYELYKNRMAMLWLLENYDYSNDFNTLKYKRKLNEEIEKFSVEAQKRNVFPMEKHDVFNEIFSALYKQHPPKEAAIKDEVHNIKMRCEIDAWFTELPLTKASGFQELFERDQILALLSKRLYDIEKLKHPDDEEKMRKEIMKWLKKIPFLPDEEENIPKYAEKLVCNLKTTEDIRKCKRLAESKKVSETQKLKDVNLNKSKGAQKARKENISQLAGPSGLRSKTCCESSSISRKKAGDLLTTAVEAWCKQLPIIDKNSNDKEINERLKDEAVVKMYQILSDLHTNPNILNNKGLYEHHLNVEIEKLLLGIPGCCELQQTRNARRLQLISELLAIRPIIKDDLDREGYKQELKHRISSFFYDTTNPNKALVNDNTKDNIIDNFIEYKIHGDDFDDKQIYKLRINEVLADLLLKNQDKPQIDPLLTSNKLICEMSKVKMPKQSVLMDELQEIEMKNVVGELLNEIEIPEHDEDKLMRRNQMKFVLAKKLKDIERAGQSCANRQKMKYEITKAFNKLGAEVNPQKVDAFVNELSPNDDGRKAFSPKDDSGPIPPPNRNVPSGPSLVLRTPQQSFHQAAPAILQLPKFAPSPPPPKRSLISTPNVPTANMSNPQSPKSSYDHSPSLSPDTVSGPRIALRQERPVIVNGLSNAYSNLPRDTDETGTRSTARIQGSPQDIRQTWSIIENSRSRNAGTIIEADNFNDCKCTRKRRLLNCKGPCKAPVAEYCDECEHDRDCEYDCKVLYPFPIPGFIFL